MVFECDDILFMFSNLISIQSHVYYMILHRVYKLSETSGQRIAVSVFHQFPFFSIVASFHVFFSFTKTTGRQLKKKNIGTFEVWYRISEQLHVYSPRVPAWNGSCFYIGPKTVSDEKSSEIPITSMLWRYKIHHVCINVNVNPIVSSLFEDCFITI